jgi:hypothetical protein
LLLCLDKQNKQGISLISKLLISMALLVLNHGCWTELFVWVCFVQIVPATAVRMNNCHLDLAVLNCLFAFLSHISLVQVLVNQDVCIFLISVAQF